MRTGQHISSVQVANHFATASLFAATTTIITTTTITPVGV